MLTWHDRWVERDGARLHYLKAMGASELRPLAYRGGALSDGTEIREDLRHLAPRTVVAAGQRGLGRSSAPSAGYAFQDQVADLGAILDDAALERPVLMAFSMGVPVLLGWALETPDDLGGLILLDHAPVYPRPNVAWAHRSREGRPDLPAHAIEAIAREARRVDLWDRIGALACPVLIVAGGRVDARLSAEHLRRYDRILPNAEVHVFDEAGHAVFAPDPERFWGTVSDFLRRLD